ncbi:MAG: hypothetical protein COA94_08140, partial [Rickettsiales bacterium]
MSASSNKTATYNISGKRRFVNVSFSVNDRSPIAALYDTGASPTAISVATMRKARQAGALGAEIKDHGVTLTNASGQNMKIHAVFWLTMRIADRTITEPVIVVTHMSGDMILGQNVIDVHGLTFDHALSQFAFAKDPSSNPTDWATATVRTSRICSIKGSEALKVQVHLFDDSTGLRMKGGVNFVADISGVPIVAKTNHNGVALLFVSNTDDGEVTIPRGTTIGTAEALDRYYMDASPVSVDTADAVIHAVAVQPKSRRKPARPTKTADGGLQASASSKSQKPSSQGDSTPKLSAAKRILINEVVIRSKIPQQYRQRYTALLSKYSDIISESPHDLGHCAAVVHDIKLRSDEPVYTKQYTLPEQEMRFIKDNVKDWLRTGVIERSTSKFNSAIFCVRKKEGQGLRVVLDYRKLNANSLPDRYSIKSADALIRDIGEAGGKVFSTIDLRSGFWQMGLAEQARHMTAFTLLGEGQFQWKRGAMGLSGCPSSFSRLIEIVTRGLENVVTYIDDILTFSKTHEEHLVHLEGLLMRLRKHNLKINIAKCSFGTFETAYLGHTLTPEGVRPGIDKAKAIRDCVPPETPKQLKSFLGVCNYFRNYLGHFARKAAPLYKLTRGDSVWKKGPLPPKAKRAFQLLQKEIAERPVLAFPNSKGRFHLYIDGALGGESKEGGLGAVLMQEQPDGQMKPIGFASRQLQEHEKNYSAFLVELAAATFAIDFFQIYLKPNTFTLYSDHKPMTNLSKVHMKTLNRLQLMMTEFHFDIKWVRGEDNIVADFLSRNAIAAINAVDTAPSTIAKAQAEDGPIAAVRRAVVTGDWREVGPQWKLSKESLHLKDDILVIELRLRQGFSQRSKWHVVLPRALHKEVMEMAHASVIGGHSGLLKTGERIRADFWWPNMLEDVATFLKECKVCQEFSDKNRPLQQPQQNFPLAPGPNVRVHVDLHGPFTDEKGDKNMIVVLTDAFTKFVQLAIISHKSAAETASAILETWIYKFGVMQTLVSDGGREFCNSLQDTLCDLLKIERKTTSPYWPRANGQVETFNKTMDHYLRTVLKEADKSPVDWRMYLGPLAFSYNTAVNRAIKMSPFRALFGYPDRAPLWDDMDILLEKNVKSVKGKGDADYLHDFAEVQKTARRLAYTNNQHDRDLRAKTVAAQEEGKTADVTYHEGQAVWVKVMQHTGKNPKLQAKWETAEIIKRVSNTTFSVQRHNRKRGRFVTLNTRYIKPRVGADVHTPDIPTAKPETTEDIDSDSVDEEVPASNVPTEQSSLVAAIVQALETHKYLSRPELIEREINKEVSDIFAHWWHWQQKLAGMKQPPFQLSFSRRGALTAPPGFPAAPGFVQPLPATPPVSRAPSEADQEEGSHTPVNSDWSSAPSSNNSSTTDLVDLVERANRIKHNAVRAERGEPVSFSRSSSDTDISSDNAATTPKGYSSPDSDEDFTDLFFTPTQDREPVLTRSESRRAANQADAPDTPEFQLAASSPPEGAAGHSASGPTTRTPSPQPSTSAAVPRTPPPPAHTFLSYPLRDKLEQERLSLGIRVTNAFTHNKNKAIIPQCMQFFGPAPLQVRKLGRQAEAAWHECQLRQSFPDVFPP